MLRSKCPPGKRVLATFLFLLVQFSTSQAFSEVTCFRSISNSLSSIDNLHLSRMIRDWYFQTYSQKSVLKFYVFIRELFRFFQKFFEIFSSLIQKYSQKLSREYKERKVFLSENGTGSEIFEHLQFLSQPLVTS